jgi:sigma-B regulation protein RsbU (phosphoserine phosphatase)
MINSLLEEQEIILLIPVIRDKTVKAALMIGDKRKEKYFSNIGINYLETIAFQLYQMLENERLFRDYIIRSSFEKELDIASYIQIRLFPKKAPYRRGFDISFYNRPYIKVTGDYFDFITIDRNNTALIIGDVSGHGMGAAMILSMISSIASAMLSETKSIERTVDEINHFLNCRYKGIELITFFIGSYNRKTREMSYINAGHCAPIYVKHSEDNISLLEGRSKILGADPHARYSASKFSLEKGDEIFLYTDGVIEIYDQRTGNGFNENDLIETIFRNNNLDIEGKVNGIIEEINNFDNDTLKDDITLIGIKIL